MRVIMRTNRWPARLLATASLLSILSISFPLRALGVQVEKAQDGVVAAQSQQQPQQQPPQTPPGQQPRTPPTPNTQTERERQEEHGTTNPALPTERERRNVPAPGAAPAAAPNAAEQTTPSQNQQVPSSAITQPVPLSPDVPDTRVGVDNNQVENLSVHDAIAMALGKNLDIENFRQSVRISQYNLFAARGVYDIASSSTINFRDQILPVASIFAGGGANSAITTKNLTYNFITNQQVERTGGFWQVEFDNSRLTTSSTAATLTTQYSPTLTASVTQPLMRNLAIDQNRRTLKLLKSQLDQSDSAFRQRVIEIINQVQDAYWDLVFAIRNEKIARQSVDLAKNQLDNNRRMVEAGTLAPIELRSTEATLETNQANVIVALQQITTSENVLKQLIIGDPNDKMWFSKINPTDDPVEGQPTVSLKDATALALKNRPELEQIRLIGEQSQINVQYFKNQLKPQVDFQGFYSTNGLAGNPTIATSGTLSPLTQAIVNNLNLALKGVGQPLFDPTTVSPVVSGPAAPDQFIGGYGQALRNLFGQSYRTWQVGIVFSFPWKNTVAKENLGAWLATSTQNDVRLRQQIQQVQVDVRNGMQALEAARLRLEAQHAAVAAAKAQYAGEQERFRAGLSTNFVVLQRLTDLITAEGNEVRALTDYNKALSDLQHVTGTTLMSNNVQAPPSLDTSQSGSKPRGGKVGASIGQSKR